jgi:hypothetical protein
VACHTSLLILDKSGSPDFIKEIKIYNENPPISWMRKGNSKE